MKVALVQVSPRVGDLSGNVQILTEALRGAAVHARDACRLDAASGEAWATLAFVLSRAGVQADAIAAGRRAVSLEPDNWRHAVRISYECCVVYVFLCLEIVLSVLWIGIVFLYVTLFFLWFFF